MGYDGYTADPYPASLNFSLPVGQEWAEAIMARHPYVYDPSLLRPDCDSWFEVPTINYAFTRTILPCVCVA